MSLWDDLADYAEEKASSTWDSVSQWGSGLWEGDESVTDPRRQIAQQASTDPSQTSFVQTGTDSDGSNVVYKQPSTAMVLGMPVWAFVLILVVVILAVAAFVIWG